MSSGAYAESYRRSLEDPAGFWGEQASAIDWDVPPATVLDASDAPYYRWFSGGRLNTCWNALDRHVEAGHGERTALVYDSPVTGTSDSFSYARLRDEVARFAGALAGLGVAAGDRVVVYMPMVPEAVVAMLACARLGAVHSVVFGGFAPHELAIRIDDAEPKVVVSASCGIEPGRIVEYKPMLDRALEQANHTPDACVILQRPQAVAAMGPLDHDWRDLAAAAEPAACVAVAATDPLYVLYTSGTTGKPKGIVRDNGGHAVALAWSMRNVYDIGPGDVFWAASDVGWVVGHSYIVYAPLLVGATTVLYEGKPVGTPDASAFWRVIAENRVKALFTAPTAMRAIKKEDPTAALRVGHDLSSLETLFLAGERLDPDTYHWAVDILGIPVVDNWWQTETGWPIAANPRGLEPLPIKAGSPSVVMPGYDVQVLDERGAPVEPGHEGNISIRLPLPPGTLPTLWNDDKRYVESYLGVFPGFYSTGDGGFIDADGYVLRHGPHRRRHQRRRTPALDRIDGGRRRDPPGRRRVRGDRRRRPAQGPGAARLRRPQVRRRHRPRAAREGGRGRDPGRDRAGRGAALGGRRPGPAEDPLGQDPAPDDARHRRRPARGAAEHHRGHLRPRRPASAARGAA